MCDYSVQDISDCILPNQRCMSEPESGERGDFFGGPKSRVQTEGGIRKWKASFGSGD